MGSNYSYPAESTSIEYEVKKSRFIGIALRAENRDQALAHLDQIRLEYPDARHHCWAYLIGSPEMPETMAQSDDGEPSGTAGKPILNVLQHKSVGDVMVVVVRYFGGIKLGAGGLVRAYSHSAQLVMEALKLEQRVAKIQVRIDCGFHQEQEVRHWLSNHQGEIGEVDYTDKVQMNCLLPEAYQKDLEVMAENRRWILSDDS